MPHSTKIATCSYCGTRTVLKLTARHGHELACGSCGAPLHQMKALKQSRPERARRPRRDHDGYGNRPSGPPRRKVRRKPRKSLWKKAFEEAFDLIEDIFD